MKLLLLPNKDYINDKMSRSRFRVRTGARHGNAPKVADVENMIKTCDQDLAKQNIFAQPCIFTCDLIKIKNFEGRIKTLTYCICIIYASKKKINKNFDIPRGFIKSIIRFMSYFCIRNKMYEIVIYFFATLKSATFTIRLPSSNDYHQSIALSTKEQIVPWLRYRYVANQVCSVQTR